MIAAVLGVVVLMMVAAAVERLIDEWRELFRTFRGLNDAGGSVGPDPRRRRPN